MQIRLTRKCWIFPNENNIKSHFCKMVWHAMNSVAYHLSHVLHNVTPDWSSWIKRAAWIALPADLAAGNIPPVRKHVTTGVATFFHKCFFDRTIYKCVFVVRKKQPSQTFEKFLSHNAYSLNSENKTWTDNRVTLLCKTFRSLKCPVP